MLVKGEGFDLLSNPFVLLSVSPSTPKAELAEALDDKLAEDGTDEQALRDALRVLLVPNQRLRAELSYLLDTPKRTSELTIDRLAATSVASELSSVAHTLPPLSKLNMIGHIAAKACDSELLVSYVDAQSEIDVETLVKRCHQARIQAGMPQPTQESIEKVLHSVIDQHCGSMLGSYSDVARAADDMQKCVKYFLGSALFGQHDSLGPLLKSYRTIIVSDQLKYGVQIDETIDVLSKHPDDDSQIGVLRDLLHKWDNLGQPLQLYEQSMDRDDPDARAMYNKIRDVSLDLANNHEQYESARALSKLSLEIFAELPRAVDQLRADLEVLDERVTASAAMPLVELIGKIEENHRGLAADLKQFGFGKSAKGVAGQLYTVFQSTIERFPDAPLSDIPWRIMRSLGLTLNNDLDDPVCSLAVIEGLTDHPQFKNVSETLRSQIEEDERTVNENVLELSLNEAVAAKNFVAAEQIADRLTRTVTDPDKKRQYEQLLQGLQERNRPKPKIWRYVIAVIVVIFVISNFVNQKPNTYRPSVSLPKTQETTEYTPPTRQPLPQAPLDSGTEIEPLQGTNNKLSAENVRYCIFEGDRLETIKSQIAFDADLVVQSFNADINDYNSRCASYQYYQSDMNKVKAESSRRTLLTGQEAARRIEGWRAAARTVTGEQLPQVSALPQAVTVPNTDVASPRAKLDLLNTEDAVMVQSVLADLGYFDGPQNGTWGQKSRRALSLFKKANGLDDDDGFDGKTEDVLFGSSAVRFIEGALSTGTIKTYVYPPPFGAKLNPLNASDAAAINEKLRSLGLFKGKQMEVWSGLSREALAAFRVSRGLPENAAWDWQVENQLFANR